MDYFRDVSYDSLVFIYKIYFHDFITFGYAPDEYFQFSRKFDFAGEPELEGLRKQAFNHYEDLRKKFEFVENPGCYEN